MVDMQKDKEILERKTCRNSENFENHFSEET